MSVQYINEQRPNNALTIQDLLSIGLQISQKKLQEESTKQLMKLREAGEQPRRQRGRRSFARRRGAGADDHRAGDDGAGGQREVTPVVAD